MSGVYTEWVSHNYIVKIRGHLSHTAGDLNTRNGFNPINVEVDTAPRTRSFQIELLQEFDVFNIAFTVPSSWSFIDEVVNKLHLRFWHTEIAANYTLFTSISPINLDKSTEINGGNIRFLKAKACVLINPILPELLEQTVSLGTYSIIPKKKNHSDSDSVNRYKFHT